MRGCKTVELHDCSHTPRHAGVHAIWSCGSPAEQSRRHEGSQTDRHWPSSMETWQKRHCTLMLFTSNSIQESYKRKEQRHTWKSIHINTDSKTCIYFQGKKRCILSNKYACTGLGKGLRFKFCPAVTLKVLIVQMSNFAFFIWYYFILFKNFKQFV